MHIQESTGSRLSVGRRLAVAGAAGLAALFAAGAPAYALTAAEIGDAPSLPPGQTPAGVGPLTAISGTVAGPDQPDLYRICVTGPFSATTVGTATFDTQLFLFNEGMAGVAQGHTANDDSGSLQSTIPSSGTYTNGGPITYVPGTYYIGISGFDNDPLDGTASLIFPSTPFGGVFHPVPGAGPLASWSGGGGTGSYTITLTGASTFASAPCAANGAVCTGAPPVGAIVGTPGKDTLTGTAGADVIFGLGGDDTINGLGGDDVLCGGSGDDLINGGDGNDFADGGADDDEINGGAGNDILNGGDLDDEINGGSGTDVINGGNGEDTLDGGAGDDVVNGGAHDDKVAGGTGNDTLSGGTGDDEISGDAGNDTLSGDAGNDDLEGGTGNDTMSGGTGDDDLHGGDGNDALSGDAGNDDLDGEAGTNTNDGGTGTDDCTSPDTAAGAVACEG